MWSYPADPNLDSDQYFAVMVIMKPITYLGNKLLIIKHKH